MKAKITINNKEMENKKNYSWTRMGGGFSNEILDGDDRFFISYNGNPDINLERRGETALVIKVNKTKTNPIDYLYFILNGDHREEYQAVYPNLGKCIVVFEENIDDVGFWSNSLEALKKIKRRLVLKNHENNIRN